MTSTDNPNLSFSFGLTSHERVNSYFEFPLRHSISLYSPGLQNFTPVVTFLFMRVNTLVSIRTPLRCTEIRTCKWMNYTPACLYLWFSVLFPSTSPLESFLGVRVGENGRPRPFFPFFLMLETAIIFFCTVINSISKNLCNFFFENCLCLFPVAHPLVLIQKLVACPVCFWLETENTLSSASNAEAATCLTNLSTSDFSSCMRYMFSTIVCLASLLHGRYNFIPRMPKRPSTFLETVLSARPGCMR